LFRKLRNIARLCCVPSIEIELQTRPTIPAPREIKEEKKMEPIGFAAVVMSFSVPLALIYAWYRVRKLRTEERLAAIAKGVAVPMADELPPHARSRKAAILLTAGGIGYTLAFVALSRFEPDAIEAAVFGIIPISVGIGYFIDAVMVRRDLHPST